MVSAAQRRIRRLRGRGSVSLGRVAGAEVFFPVLDWVLAIVAMFVFYLILVVGSRDLQRQNLLAVLGFLGVAIMVQSVLYVLGSIAAAKIAGLRVAAVQLGPVRRMGRFVTYHDRGRRFFFFYALRSIPTLLVWQICQFAWSSGAAGPAFALIGQICMLSVAFALLPTPGSDGQRIVQSALWWLTGSVAKAARWSLWICLALSALLIWAASGRLTGDSAFLWMIAMLYLGIGAFTYLGGLASTARMRTLDTIPLDVVARPVALALPGARRDQYPLDHVGMVVSDGALLGAVDDSAVGRGPVEASLLPSPAAPVVVDPRESFVEPFLGMVDEGCDVVMLGSGNRFAVLTLQDCARVLGSLGLSYDTHLGMP